MYCIKCGTQNPEDSTYCVSCGAPLNQESPSSATNNFQQPQQQAPTYQTPTSGYVNNSYQPVNNGVQGAPVQNNMVLSVITLVLSVFCCNIVSIVLSIIATVFSTQVAQKQALGNTDDAIKTAKNAKLLALISIGFMVLEIIGTIIYFVIVFAALASHNY